MNPDCIRFNALRFLSGTHLDHEITKRIFQQIKELSACSIKELIPHDQSISENMVIATIASLLKRQYISVCYEYNLEQWGATEPYWSETSSMEFNRRYARYILAGQLEIEDLTGKPDSYVEYDLSRALGSPSHVSGT